MKDYELWLVRYATYINELEDILSDENWEEKLDDIVNYIRITYNYRKDLREYESEIQDDLKELDERLLKIGEKLKEISPL